MLSQKRRILFEDLESFINKIDGADELNEILNILQQQVSFYGFEKVTYWLRWPSKENKPPIFLSTYPEKFINHYIESDFQSHDMVGRYSSGKNTPFLWSDIEKQFIITKMQKILFDDSASVGLRAGGSIPVNGPGHIQATFSVTRDCSQKEFEEIFLYHRHELQILATYCHERIMSLGITNPIKDVNLSSREIEVLTWVARGKTYWEIGIILTIQEDTIKKHMLSIFSKLQVSNNSHAVSKALLHGLIIP